MAPNNLLIDFEVVDFQPITVGSTPTRLIPEKVKQQGVFITVEQGALRYRFDGKNATAGIGHIANDGDKIRIKNAHAARKLSMRRIGTKNAVIMVSYLEA